MGMSRSLGMKDDASTMGSEICVAHILCYVQITMSFFFFFLTIAVVHMLALISAGPDFALITRQSLVYSRRTGVYTAIGIGLGILVHVTYSIVGIGYIIAQSMVAFTVVKLVGAIYLIFIGWKALKSKPSAGEDHLSVEKQNELSSRTALWMGFLTNALNAKASLFFLGLFTQVIRPETPLSWQLVYGFQMSLMTMAWFSFVTLVFTQPWFKNRVLAYRHWLDRAFGAILIALGIKVALSSQK